MDSRFIGQPTTCPDPSRSLVPGLDTGSKPVASSQGSVDQAGPHPSGQDTSFRRAMGLLLIVWERSSYKAGITPRLPDETSLRNGGTGPLQGVVPLGYSGTGNGTCAIHQNGPTLSLA